MSVIVLGCAGVENGMGGKEARGGLIVERGGNR